MANKKRESGRSNYGKTSLIDDVTAQTQGYSRRQVAEIVDAILSTIKQEIAAGHDVTLTGFGTFRRSERAAREGTNIRTRERIQIPAQQSVRFTPGSELKAAVGGRAATRRSAQSVQKRGRGRLPPNPTTPPPDHARHPGGPTTPPPPPEEDWR